MTQIGAAAFLMTRCRYQTYASACLRIWVEPAIDLDQARFFYDAAGKPVGYVTWAWLAPDVASRLVGEGAFNLHLSEWNEGPELWIMDLVAPFGHAADILRACADLPEFAAAPHIRYVRRKADGSIRKVGRVRHPNYRGPAASPNC